MPPTFDPPGGAGGPSPEVARRPLPTPTWVMKASIPLSLLIFLGSFACAHSQPSDEELRAGEPPVPQLGVVGAVDEGTLALQVAGSNQPLIFQRTTQTEVICAGVQVGW